MKAWEYGDLQVSESGRYLKNGEEPFFWLADTAWLLFQKCSLEESWLYLKNRKEKGFTVIQAVLVHSVPESEVMSSLANAKRDVRTKEYWAHCDQVIHMAEELGLYMALLPSWGAVVKGGILNEENIEGYMEFLVERYGQRPNVIWLLGGDIRGNLYQDFYEKEGRCLRSLDARHLIGFHPFGRTSSSLWFHEDSWLDFNMFQSGHRRYDQVALGQWDDNTKKEEFFGEDNWRYVERDLGKQPRKPTVDGEPSYEWIPQGLHDPKEPFWQAEDVRRYAYWSVFTGAMGHTYGDNAIMQFYQGDGDVGSYGVKECWQDALHHQGAGQMQYLRRLMESVDYQAGAAAQALLASAPREKYGRVSVFAGEGFLFAYTYSGEAFALDLSRYADRKLEASWYDPSSGIESYFGTLEGGGITEFRPVQRYSAGTDWVLVLRG